VTSRHNEKAMRKTGAKERPWTTGELALLRKHASEGAEAVAAVVGRSISSVRCAASRHDISLRRPGERRGRVLGQVRDADLPPGYREDILDGRLDATEIAEHMRLAADPDTPLCPECVRRPVSVPKTGLCGVCHKRRLAESHREKLDELEAQRDLWRSRQQLKRERDREPCLS